MKTSYVLVDSDGHWMQSEYYPNGIVQFDDLKSCVQELEGLESDGLNDLSIIRIQEAKVKLVRGRRR